MSSSTTILDLISASQSSKEVTANALFDAGSPATLYGRRATTTSALTWGYYGGILNISGTLTVIGNGTVALTASTTNYVEVAPATGVVSKNTSAFTAGYIPLYSVVTDASSATSYLDKRSHIFAHSPHFTTPVLGVATVTSLNGHTFTAGSSVFTGTAGQTYTFPATTATLARTDAANIFTGVQTMTSPAVTTPAFTGAFSGTYTIGGTPTLNACTLAGTISGGGNQVNNVVIGTVTPLAGNFAALNATGVFACNGNTGQAKATVDAASTDLATVVALCNQLRAALVANGIAV